MRASLVLCVFAAACGDNADACGYVDIMTYLRNIWPGHLAIDDHDLYYSDYDVDGSGTHIVLRHPLDEYAEVAIGVRPVGYSFGSGMAVDDTYLYWTAQTEPIGYSLYATPLPGARAFELTTLGDCDPHGVAADPFFVYAGTARCADQPSRVVAVGRDGARLEIWSSNAADVEDLVARDGHVYIATTGGLVDVVAGAAELLDGHPTHRLQLTSDELVYSTDEGVFARSLAGGPPRRLYEFHTAIEQVRAFAIDDRGLYVSEPPQILYVPLATENPQVLVENAGLGISYMVARRDSVYWSSLVIPNGSLIPDTFSGGVLRALRPCGE